MADEPRGSAGAMWAIATEDGHFLLARAGFSFTTRGSGVPLRLFRTREKAEDFCVKQQAGAGWDLLPIRVAAGRA